MKTILIHTLLAGLTIALLADDKDERRAAEQVHKRMKQVIPEEPTALELEKDLDLDPTEPSGIKPVTPRKISPVRRICTASFANAKVRFIRLKYQGGDWDQDMGKGSDYNLLLKLKDLTGFKIADNTEAIRATDLAKFPAKHAPPFLYITGRGKIEFSPKEIKALRTYLVDEGGMLFADNGGGNFDQGFRALMKKVFPDKQLLDIADDDAIYQSPYRFPNGAPPLWHHSGNRALGIKDENRWMVFYHQGDINDAWKTGGAGAKEHIRDQAFKMGINVIAYAFNYYLAKHNGKEKAFPQPATTAVPPAKAVTARMPAGKSKRIPKVLLEIREVSKERPSEPSIQNLDADFE